MATDGLTALEEMRRALHQAAEDGVQHLRFTLAENDSRRVTDAQLEELLLTALPMAQGVQRVITRSRGRGLTLRLRIRWRDGWRMAEYALNGRGTLNAQEASALFLARAVAEPLRSLEEEKRLARIYDWVCGHVRYRHTAPGCKGYEQLVSAVGAIMHGEANCQGFADATYLLCRLAGLEARCCCGRGERLMHVWNEVRLDGAWHRVDASRGARSGAGEGANALQAP